MAAELHLAEDALALHLLLQHLEGLVDIVVTDENLHAAFLFDRAIDGTDGQDAPGHWRTDVHNSDAYGTRDTDQRRYLKSCLPMGTMAANWKKRRLRYVSVFWAALQTSHCRQCTPKRACRSKEQWISRSPRD